MDPLPSVSNAYLMIEQIEQQRQVITTATSSREIAAITERTNPTTCATNLEQNNADSNPLAAKGSTM